MHCKSAGDGMMCMKPDILIKNKHEVKAMDTWIFKMNREKSVRKLTVCALLAVCIGLFLFTQKRYIQNFIDGPYNLSAADLDSIRDVSQTPRYFARVSGSKAIDTEIQKIKISTKNGVETGRSVAAKYYALVIGDKFLIYEGDYTPLTTVEGALAEMPAEVSNHLFSSREMMDIRRQFYPFYLNTRDFRSTGYVAIVILVCLCAFLAYISIPAWRHLRNPALHPLIKRSGSWGNPMLIASAIEQQSSTPRFKAGGWTVTKEFLIKSTFFTFDILRVCDLLWAYKKVTQHRINFIPAGKSYAAILICYGGTAEIAGSEIAADHVLSLAAASAPWAVFGFSQEIQDFFNKSASDFRAAIESRKQEMLKK